MLELISRPVDMELKLGMALNYSHVRVFKPCDGDLLDGGDLSGDPVFGSLEMMVGEKSISTNIIFIFGAIGTTHLHKFAYGLLLQTSVVMRPQDPSAWKNIIYALGIFWRLFRISRVFLLVLKII